MESNVWSGRPTEDVELVVENREVCQRKEELDDAKDQGGDQETDSPGERRLLFAVVLDRAAAKVGVQGEASVDVGVARVDADAEGQHVQRQHAELRGHDVLHVHDDYNAERKFNYRPESRAANPSSRPPGGPSPASPRLWL
jgi:hypothetical protein